jgi:succinate-acetate transporter protein
VHQGRPDDVSVHPQVRVVVKPYGSALPLGFFAFGIGMFLYAAQGAEWVKASDGHTVGLILATFVAPLEFLATVVAFLARDTMSAAALGLFSTSWLSGGILLTQAKPGVLDRADAYWLIAFTVVVLLLGVAAWEGKPMISVLLLVASARGLLYAIYQLGAGKGWMHASGWIALVLFLVAMYGGLAFLLEDARGETVLPLLRRGKSREAIEGGLAAQLQGLAEEAGVRHTL